MKKTILYELVGSNDKIKFLKLVKELIKKGHTPKGGVSVVLKEEKICAFQVMVKLIINQVI
jgi:hypothetical protein